MERTSDDKMIFRVTDDERVEIVDASLERDITITELVKRSIRFYTGFPIGFIEQMEKVSKEYKTDVSTMVARLMLVYVATDKAIIDNFGFSKTFERAFRFDETGKLIEAEKLSDITFEEVDKGCKEVLKKMKWMAAGKEDKETLLTKEQGAYVRVLHEARVAMVAKAKGR